MLSVYICAISAARGEVSERTTCCRAEAQAKNLSSAWKA